LIYGARPAIDLNTPKRRLFQWFPAVPIVPIVSGPEISPARKHVGMDRYDFVI